MKASDLRIGNFVNNKGRLDIVTCLEHVTFEDITNVRGQYYEVFIPEPTPLTEEWLLRFGFDHHYDLGKRKFMNIKTLTIETNSSENFPVYYTTQKIIICYIKYVHQLQNLYFALTGEELVVKE